MSVEREVRSAIGWQTIWIIIVVYFVGLALENKLNRIIELLEAAKP